MMIFSILKNQTVLNFLSRALQILLKHGINFYIFFTASYLLTPYNFGIYNYILSIILILVIFSDFGISTSATKFITEWVLIDDSRYKKVAFNMTLCLLLFFFLVLFFVFVLNLVVKVENFNILIYAAPLIFLIPGVSLFDGLYRGLNRFNELKNITAMCSCLVVFLIYPAIKYYGLIAAVLIQVFFYLSLFLFLVVRYRNNIYKVDFSIVRSIFKYALIIGIGNIGLVLYNKIDNLFLGYYGFYITINYLEILNKILMLVVLPVGILSQVLFPEVIRLFSKNETNKVITLFNKYVILSAVYGFATTLLVCLVLPKLGPVFFPQYYGEEFMFIVYLMSLVFFTQTINTIPPSGFAVATGHAKLVTLVLTISGLLHFLLNIILFSLFKEIGVVYSIVLTKCGTDIFFIYYYKKLLKNSN